MDNQLKGPIVGCIHTVGKFISGVVPALVGFAMDEGSESNYPRSMLLLSIVGFFGTIFAANIVNFFFLVLNFVEKNRD